MAVNAAEKGFAVQELAESILLYLDIIDILQAQQVNRLLFTTIVETSQPLRRKLMLAPDHSCEHRDLDAHIPDAAQISIRHSPQHPLGMGMDPSAFIALKLSDKALSSRRLRGHLFLGKRVQQMLLCQPPAHKWEICAYSLGRMHKMSDARPIDQLRKFALDDSSDMTLGALLREVAKIKKLLPPKPGPHRFEEWHFCANGFA